MSFILDALRKSESERQRQASPGLADAQYHVANKQRSIWLPLLSVILAANLIVFATIFLIRGTSPKNISVPDAPSARNQVTEVELPVVVESVRPAAEEIRRVEPVVAASTSSPPIAAAPEPMAGPEELVPSGLPRMQQLIQSGQLSIDPLRMDIHVFAGNPEKRFVFINMNKYREGDRLDEGPTLERITTGGAILNHQGTQFTMDRE